MADFHNITSPEYVKEHFALHRVPPEAYATPFETMTVDWCLDEGAGEGIAPGWIVTVGGGTGSGKSLIALNFAKAAIIDGAKIGFVSLEMSHRQLATRFYAMLGNLSARRLERGDKFDPRAQRIIEELVEQGTRDMPGGPRFYVNEDPLPRLDELLDVMRLWRDWGVDFYVVDYLQLCTDPNEQGQAAELASITSALRLFAKNEGARILGLSQYTLEARRAMRKDSRTPTHDDYIGSSAISNNSHLCLCLDGSRFIRDRDEGHDFGRTYLLNTKSRVGPTGQIPIEWNYRTLTVREAQPDEEQKDWPT